MAENRPRTHPAPPSGNVRIVDPHAEHPEGDVFRVAPEPLLTPPEGTVESLDDRGGEVLYNHTRATDPDGYRCVMITGGAHALTAAEAVRVGRDLMEIGAHAAEERTKRGFDR